MSIQLKAAQAKFVAIDTDFDLFGEASAFSLEIIDANTGSLVTNDGTGTFTEVMWTDPARTGTTVGNTLAGATFIVATGHDFTVGDRLDDGAGNIYYVTAVTVDNIYVKGEIVADIADATAIASVGNTGIYRVDIQLANVGEYFVNFAGEGFGHTSVKVEVIETMIDDVYDRLDEGFNALGANKSFKVIA